MTFLIDGYNLMHMSGLLRVGMPAGGLQRARRRFLDWLADSMKGRADVLCVIFDAEKGTGPSPESDHRGVRVRFAYKRTADDEIEELLAAESRPERITVVSNDTRLQTAGRRRGSGVHTCEAFLDWLITEPRESRPQPPSQPEKPEDEPTPDELAAWLDAFQFPPKRRSE